MKPYIKERVISIANYTIAKKSTVRATAKAFNVSKSTVHKDLTDRLPIISKSLFQEVSVILQQNKDERHLRGGLATKEKYLRMK